MSAGDLGSESPEHRSVKKSASKPTDPAWQHDNTQSKKKFVGTTPHYDFVKPKSRGASAYRFKDSPRDMQLKVRDQKNNIEPIISTSDEPITVPEKFTEQIRRIRQEKMTNTGSQIGRSDATTSKQGAGDTISNADAGGPTSKASNSHRGQQDEPTSDVRQLRRMNTKATRATSK